jgi:hypothetical protein
MTNPFYSKEADEAWKKLRDELIKALRLREITNWLESFLTRNRKKIKYKSHLRDFNCIIYGHDCGYGCIYRDVPQAKMPCRKCCRVTNHGLCYFVEEDVKQNVKTSSDVDN